MLKWLCSSDLKRQTVPQFRSSNREGPVPSAHQSAARHLQQQQVNGPQRSVDLRGQRASEVSGSQSSGRCVRPKKLTHVQGSSTINTFIDNNKILNLTQNWTGSQWRVANTGLICSRFLVPARKQAAAFCSPWRRRRQNYLRPTYSAKNYNNQVTL